MQHLFFCDIINSYMKRKPTAIIHLNLDNVFGVKDTDKAIIKYYKLHGETIVYY